MKFLKSVKRSLPIFLLLLVLLVTGCSPSKKIAKVFVLSETEVSMMVGTTKTLSLENPKNTDVGDYTLVWETAEPAVATVADDGTVTAVASGNTKITVTVRTEKAEVSFFCTVTVTENNTPLSSLSFGATVYALGEGQMLDLKKELLYNPSYAAAGPLTWTSSNPDIAAVDNGVVTPVSQGISNVTVSTKDGKISAFCTVRVSDVSIDPEGISFSEPEIEANVGQKLKLTPEITPKNATGYTISWSSSDEEIATVSKGNVTLLKEGSVTITASLSLGDEKISAECNITVGSAVNVYIPATKVKISPPLLTISDDVYGPFKLDLTVSPANATGIPHWSSSNSQVLKIDPETGEFTVADTVKEDVSVVVTCTLDDASDSAVVYVSARKPRLEIGIEEDADLYDAAPFNKLQLVAAFANSDVLPEVTWKSSDKTVASVSASGMVTGLKKGTCTVTATLKSDTSVTAKYEVTVKDTGTEADFISVAVGKTVVIPSHLIPKGKTDIAWTAPSLYLKLNTSTMSVTGVRATSEEPTTISGYSASDGKFYSIKVYVTD